jgi:hypothetical protein
MHEPHPDMQEPAVETHRSGTKTSALDRYHASAFGVPPGTTGVLAVDNKNVGSTALMAVQEMRRDGSCTTGMMHRTHE